MSKEKPNFISLLDKLHYKQNYIPNPEHVALKIGYEIVGTLGNFIVYAGLPKSGKSTFINAAIASLITNKELFNHSLSLGNKKKKKLGYFDTESSESDFYNNIERIKFIGRGTALPDDINIFSLREYGPTEIRELIEFYIITFKPQIVVIDGLLDIIDNFNDERESKNIINWLKKITSEHNILIIGVIHLGKKDNHTLGHFGAMIDRYAQSVLEVKRDYENNIYTLTPRYLRSAKNWFKEFSYQWTGNDYVECTTPEPPQKKRAR